MDWSTATQGKVLVGRPRGRVDESNGQAFSAALVAAIEAARGSTRRFVVDLADIDYMSSRGLRSLSTALAAAKAAGVEMCLAAPGVTMREILAISRYDTLFQVFDSVAAAAIEPGA